jgi:hypothetical protein
MPAFLQSTTGKAIAALAGAVVVGVGLTWALRGGTDPSTIVDQDEMITAWNSAVSRLGINPVYPPSEDFHVGDLWAVLIEDENADRDDRSNAALGKSVRLLHMPFPEDKFAIRWDAGETRLVGSSQTVAFQQDDELRRPQAGNLRMSVVNFPGLTINAKAKLDLKTGALGFIFGADSESFEVMKISSAVTYGVSAVEANIGLSELCDAVASNRFAVYCTDAFARTILASSVNSRALDTITLPNGQRQYKHAVQLRLISRVFLTRQIEQRRFRSSGGKIEADATAGKPGGAGEFGTSFDIGLNGIARRPVVFGHRSVGRELARSTPN